MWLVSEFTVLCAIFKEEKGDNQWREDTQKIEIEV